MTQPQPRCPFCSITGIDKLATKSGGFFTVIFCGGCGAIYGVVPSPKPTPKPAEAPPAEAPPAEAPPAEVPLTPDQAAAMMMYYGSGGTRYRKFPTG